MSEDVAADALGRLQRFWAEHFLVALGVVFLLALIGGLWFVAIVLTMDTWTPTSGPERAASLVAVVVVFSSAIGAWSIVTTFQRAVLIALGSGSATRTLSQAFGEVALRARSLCALGAVLGMYGVAVGALGAVGVVLARDVTQHFAVALALFSWCFVGWLGTRPILGIATASIVEGHETFAVACRNSARHLGAHRAASLSTRRILVPPCVAVAALMAAVLTTDAPGPGWVIATVILLPVIVSCDATIEAAWYDRLRARVDVQKVAAVFG